MSWVRPAPERGSSSRSRAAAVVGREPNCGGGPSRGKPAALAGLLLAASWGAPGAEVVAQEPSAREAAPSPPVDTASLAEGRLAEMRTRYRPGFLFIRVDAVDVRVRFGPETVARFRSAVAEADGAEALRDSVARVAWQADDAFAELEFLRRVGLERFLDVTRENLDRAADAGILPEPDARRIAADLPGWFAFLRDRGIRDGDRLLYRIRGDTLRTLFLAAEGVLLDQTDVGPERRRAVLGGYYAPGADFREGLLDGLLSPE